ncbi:MAG TPA: hypothetical protein VHX65_09255 [Pirellulales bacterium]|jgi:hypothetical protein|nr:hypothetical protein [Pirellulales bacterium]
MKLGAIRLYMFLIVIAWLGVGPFVLAEEADTHEGLVVSAAAGKLAITGIDGKPYSYDIGDQVKVTVNGHMGKLDDLKTGARVRVTTDKKGRALNVATVDAVKDRYCLD